MTHHRLYMRQTALIFSVVSCLTFVSGCTGKLDAETQLAHKRVEVHSYQVAENIPNSEMTDGLLAALAHEYRNKGAEGTLNIAVQYDPASVKNTAMHATNEVARINRELRRKGVKNINTEILPVKGVGEEAVTLVSYDAYHAQAPEDCDEMPGMDNTSPDWKVAKGYGFGCSIEARIAKQVARPGDLLGRGMSYETSDGRRAGNVLEAYRAGIPNERLEGQLASDD